MPTVQSPGEDAGDDRRHAHRVPVTGLDRPGETGTRSAPADMASHAGLVRRRAPSSCRASRRPAAVLDRVLRAGLLLCLVAASRTVQQPRGAAEGAVWRQHLFRTRASSTFRAVARGVSVNLTFLDGTRMQGFDGQDFVQLAQVHACTHTYTTCAYVHVCVRARGHARGHCRPRGD